MSECDKYQEMISQMLDGELPEPHKTELVKHLGCCPDCRRVYDAFSAISLSLGETAAPEGFAGDVMAAVRTQGVHGSGRSKAPGKSLARYLKGLHENGATTIVFGGETYEWDESNGNIGSKWFKDGDDANASLVKAIDIAWGNQGTGVGLTAGTTKTATLTVDGVRMTYTVVIAAE